MAVIIAKRHFNPDEIRFFDVSFVNAVFKVNRNLHIKYENSDIEYISIIDPLCDKRGCLAKVDNKNTPLVWDYGHLSLEGSKYIVENIIKDKVHSYL
ncbi:SGNH hydrolase domain-containing protein [Shewanella sp. SR44-3]|uniref:SGNH hydrolase domain-containing protein n=1 Tax=Shewanella sp. SR44-3 TaxID=2760936 RepID=UPI0015FAF9F6|nr:SGNH hydrolase domain-containing protein [Shewanella sp. SR44-3]MBB1269298.1 hypothetical protein [Shewanella sp. SR44-3]